MPRNKQDIKEFIFTGKGYKETKGIIIRYLTLKTMTKNSNKPPAQINCKSKIKCRIHQAKFEINAIDNK